METLNRIISSCLFALLAGAFFTADSLYAETYSLDWRPYDNPMDAFFGPGGGKIEEINAEFTTETNRLKFSVNFSRSTNNNCDSGGYIFAITGDERVPYGQDGEVAVFFVDASDLTNPRVTAYGKAGTGGLLYNYYDGSMADGIQAADKIFSSILHSSEVFSLTARDETDGTRTIGFDIDATRINEHTPLYPSDDQTLYPWTGARIGSHLGIWMKTFCGLNSNYVNGFIEEAPYPAGFTLTGGVGHLDTAINPPAELENPFCEGLESSYTALIGQPFSLDFDVVDGQNQEVRMDYSGLVSGMSFTRPSGFTAPTTYSVGFDWTPSVDQGGASYPITVELTDSEGYTGLCQFDVEVPLNVAPKCVAADPIDKYAGLACGAETTTITLSGVGSVDQDDASIGGITTSWSTDCPGAVIEDPTAMETTMTFDSEVDGIPTACNVSLEVSDGIDSSQCGAPVNLQPCIRDCEGVIDGDAEYDICNVCEGDGTSCRPECADVDIFVEQGNIDASTLELQRLVNIAARKLRNKVGTKKAKRQARRAKAQAKELYKGTWMVTWEFSTVMQTCEESIFCVQTSNLPDLAEINGNAVELNEIVRRTVRQLRRGTGNKKTGGKLIRRADIEQQNIAVESAQIPLNEAACDF